MIDIHITGATPDELLDTLVKLAEKCSYGGPMEKIAKETAELFTEQDVKEMTDITAAYPADEGTPAGEIHEAVMAARESTPAPVKNAEPAPTLADVRKALLALQSAKGKDAARAILAAHDVKNVLDLKEAEYADVIKQAGILKEADANAAN